VNRHSPDERAPNPPTLHGKFTMLQVIGSVLMLGCSFVTQTKTGKGIKKTSAVLPARTPIRTVTSQQKRAVPRRGFPAAHLLGLSLRPRRGDVLWQLIADCPAGFPERARCRDRGRGMPRLCGGDAVILADPAQARLLGRHQGMSSENLPWFLSSAVLVAISQAFVYASLAVAPLMVVTPILSSL
jgi:hypothetical protein